MVPEAPPTAAGPSLGELFTLLMKDTTTLVRQEMTLAKAELGEKAAKIGRNVGLLAAGGAVAYAGLLAVLAAIISLLAHAGMAWWAAALLVGVVVATVGGILGSQGLNALKHEDLAPRQTLETLREDTQWIKDRAA
jgi:Putative Actinobacterial Holin-X, holin superfamily III